VRILAVALVAALAAVVVSAAPAQQPARASAEAAVIAGTLGHVARVRASGDDAASRSVPSRLPDGVELGDGFVSVSTSVSSAVSATAQAEADDVSLLGGAITATLVQRIAEAAEGGVEYRGSVRGLVVGDREIGTVSRGKTYTFDGGAVAVNRGGAGLVVTLASDFGGAPAGTEIRVADVTASASGAAATPQPTATATATPQPTSTPTPTATPKPPKRPPSYKRRLMRKTFMFPVGGPTQIGGPFGSFRADTGSHEGNDLFADFGTPVVAVADGTIDLVGSLPISGNRLWVYADGGDHFFYAHLSAFAPAAVRGRHVERGTVLGYVGNTGDAEPTPPHLHFEIHPGGGDAVDPHPFLVAWQERAGAALTDTAERPGALVEVRDFIGES
jgi:murein DD-endopeptidase MepM/ murein hydrolase activator NlpD